MLAGEISEVEWQMWVDQVSREGLPRSLIANTLAVASSVDAWALAPSRRFVTRNPLRMVELQPNDEEPRLRVALVPEQLLDALTPEDRVRYALACYAGLRGSEIHRLQWPDVLEDGQIASHVLVLRSKSEAGTQRRPPIVSRCSKSSGRRGYDRVGRPRGLCRNDRSCLASSRAPRRQLESAPV